MAVASFFLASLDMGARAESGQFHKIMDLFFFILWENVVVVVVVVIVHCTVYCTVCTYVQLIVLRKFIFCEIVQRRKKGENSRTWQEKKNKICHAAHSFPNGLTGGGRVN